MSNKHTYSLNELLSSIQRCIDKTYDGYYWIKAETSDFRVNTSLGHAYMELIEKGHNGNIIARVRANIWRNNVENINRKFAQADLPKISSGINILCLVQVKYTPLYGLSLIIDDIDPAYSLGEIAKLRQQTIEKLKATGVFDLNKQLSIPRPIKRIALITSETAAGKGDFLTHLSEYYGYSFLQIALFPATMQGERVTDSVISALEKIHNNKELFDCVVIIRGGGAVSELRAFDDYNLCYYAAQFPLPIITGIGHERDNSVLDMIVAISKKTPTAVANFLGEGIDQEFVLLDKINKAVCDKAMLAISDNTRILDRLTTAIPNMANKQIRAQERYINIIESTITASAQAITREAYRSIDNIKSRISSSIKSTIQNQQSYLSIIPKTLNYAINRTVSIEKERIERLSQFIRLSHPDNVLKRGYAIIHNKNNVITSTKDLKSGDSITVKFADGETNATIEPNKK